MGLITSWNLYLSSKWMFWVTLWLLGPRSFVRCVMVWCIWDDFALVLASLVKHHHQAKKKINLCGNIKIRWKFKAAAIFKKKWHVYSDSFATGFDQRLKSSEVKGWNLQLLPITLDTRAVASLLQQNEDITNFWGENLYQILIFRVH